MLTELHIENLGVIESATITLDSGLVALTGETGAGKTMIVEAIGLLLGGRADAGVVRPGADEARIEGRFVDESGERILARVVPADGRSRAYVNGRMATVAQLADMGADLSTSTANTRTRVCSAHPTSATPWMSTQESI